MSQTVEAIFKDGIFKPVDDGSLDLSEGQRVTLTVELPPQGDANLLELAGQVYEDLSEDEINEIERLTLERGNFFHDRPAS